MYIVKPTKAYKKSRKKILRSGRFDARLLDEVINLLATGKILAEKYQDHSLSGDFSECRECHIKPDVLLIYAKIENELILVLVDIGSHPRMKNS
jgi:mRNA interferase YafQ